MRFRSGAELIRWLHLAIAFKIRLARRDDSSQITLNSRTGDIHDLVKTEKHHVGPFIKQIHFAEPTPELKEDSPHSIYRVHVDPIPVIFR